MNKYSRGAGSRGVLYVAVDPIVVPGDHICSNSASNSGRGIQETVLEKPRPLSLPNGESYSLCGREWRA